MAALNGMSGFATAGGGHMKQVVKNYRDEQARRRGQQRECKKTLPHTDPATEPEVRNTKPATSVYLNELEDL